MNTINIQWQNYPILDSLIDVKSYLIEKGSREGSSEV